MRFVVDHCVPIEVARWLSAEGHQAWTAYEAGLGDAADDELLIYAQARSAALVTTNRDCAQLARRIRAASVIWLAVVEVEAVHAMRRAATWLDAEQLPDGRVLRVAKTADPKVLTPRPLR